MALHLFLIPLHIPRVLRQRSKDVHNMKLRWKSFHRFHNELPETKFGGMKGKYLATIEVEQRMCSCEMDLPDEHLLPVDPSLHSGEHMPQVRTVVHLHGAEVEPDSDGYPDAWFTRDFGKCGPRFVQKVYKYPNNQRPATLWYHDHAVGITRLNVYAGLAGMYIIRNEQERALNLPSGRYEIPLVIQDRTFNDDGSLFYPSTVNVVDPPPNFPNPSITPGVAGDTIVVNGKAWPYLNVEQRRYRFRILNGSNERFYRLFRFRAAVYSNRVRWRFAAEACQIGRISNSTCRTHRLCC